MDRVTTVAPTLDIARKQAIGPGLLHLCGEDWDTVVERDPSIRGRGEGLLHPALAALWATGSPIGSTSAACGFPRGC